MNTSGAPFALMFIMIETNVGHHNIEESSTSYPSDTVFGMLDIHRNRDDEESLRGKAKKGQQNHARVLK